MPPRPAVSVNLPRKEGQPFFAIVNIGDSHESRAHGSTANTRHDPAKMVLHSYHPDLPEIRQDWARFHDLITLMDGMVGRRLRELDDAGVAENTIVFFGLVGAVEWKF